MEEEELIWQMSRIYSTIESLVEKGLIEFEEVCGRPAVRITIENLQYLELLKDGKAYLMLEDDSTWVWDGFIMEG
tara:strand:+ start:13405 stop:13629 length:225 start_codon:yes stop_codon:yes gene_type:complete